MSWARTDVSLTSRPLTNRLLSVIFVAAGGLHLGVGAINPPERRPVAWLAVGLVYLVIGLWLYRTRDSSRGPWAVAVLIGLNIALVALMAATSPVPPGALSVLLFWDIPFVWSLFRLRVALPVTLLQAALGVGMILRGAAMADVTEPHLVVGPAAVFVLTVGVLALCTRVLLNAFVAMRRTSLELAAQAEHAAVHDPLTGLGNRALYAERLPHAIGRARRNDTHVCVMVIDLDEFKLVNDSLGHYVGDELLRAVGRRLVGAFRAQDTVARLGGDEFVVICEDLTAPEDGVAIARHVLRSLREPVDVDGHELYVSASIGMTLLHETDGGPDAALRDADAAMYQAKRRGRGLVEVYDEALRESVTRQLSMENGLRRALDGPPGTAGPDELRTVYQPIVDLRSGAIVGAEALARWTSPELGEVSPEEFIRVAEGTGLIVRLGERVLDDALEALHTWREVRPDITVAVNVSAHELQGSDYAERVSASADRHHVALTFLNLEITEHTALAQSAVTVGNIGRLSAHGVRFSLDDFGTGYSSLAALRLLPLAALKIDITLRDDPPVLRACRDLGTALGLRVIAEGVESDAARERFSELDYEYAQGFLFGRPMTGEAFGALLAGEVVGS
ncbi:EAL domain-containing protein [Cellulomonas cellasea]|uniref:Diguanylate cyclase (GGDEF)-like protein n=1 Tax=Cellulomonas cellasea TaxID=43670 RepID=A0A7W4UI49_9CELL|nr:EAL domain-containing protein [Cellulomonas cellasea]MBB2924125.1 diguanylate cyclase (GGDEF)-like protein [Cellulomonas cellasea]